MLQPGKQMWMVQRNSPSLIMQRVLRCSSTAKMSIAVEVHQYAPNTSDMSFNLELGGANSCVDCVNTTVLSSTHLKDIPYL